MLDEWRKNTLIMIYKNNEDIQNFTSYKGMSHTKSYGKSDWTKPKKGDSSYLKSISFYVWEVNHESDLYSLKV